jgi:hypothetical protein
VGEEQLLHSPRGNEVKLYFVRDADVAHASARAGRMDRLHHWLLRADALEHRVSTDPSVGSLRPAWGMSSVRTSLAACMTVARMVVHSFVNLNLEAFDELNEHPHRGRW